MSISGGQNWFWRVNWKSRTITYEETVDTKEFKKTKEQRKNEWTTKKIHGQFARDMEGKDKNNYISYTECGKLAQKK